MELFAAICLLLLTRLAVAQSQCKDLTTGFGDCVYSCVTAAAVNAGCTDATELTCLCAELQQIEVGAASCALQCPSYNLALMTSAGSSICSCLAASTQIESVALPTPINTSASTSSSYMSSDSGSTVTYTNSLSDSGSSSTATSTKSFYESRSISESSDSLSDGAKAGIALGVVAALLETALVAFLVWRRYRRKRLRHGQPEMQRLDQRGPSAESHRSQHGDIGRPTALSSHEMAADGIVHTKRYELFSESPKPSPTLGRAELDSQSSLAITPLRRNPPTGAAELPSDCKSPKPKLDYFDGQTTGSTGPLPEPIAPHTSSADSGAGASSHQSEQRVREMAQMREQHAALEARRRRLLELEQIESEQSSLQQRMSALAADGDLLSSAPLLRPRE